MKIQSSPSSASTTGLKGACSRVFALKGLLSKIARKLIPSSIQDIFSKCKFVRGTELFSKNPIQAILKLARWLVLHWMNREISFATPDGTHFISMARNFSSFCVYFADYRDPPIQLFLRHHLHKGSVFVDAGANIGTYTIRAAQLVGSEGKVIAVEAHPHIYGYLQKNIALQGLKNVIPLNIALDAQDGTAEMSYNSSNAGMTHVAVHGEKAISVPSEALDGILTKLGVQQVDYLKIDVEGFEFPVLQGAKKIIANSPDIVIQTELDNTHAQRYGRSVKEVIDLLCAWGLTPHLIDNNGNANVLLKSEIEVPSDLLWWREIDGATS